MFRKQIFAIEEQLRVADVRQSIERPGLIWMTANVDGTLDEIGVWPGLSTFLQQRRQVSQKLATRETGKPRIVEHDQVVGAGARIEIYQFFLKKICMRKLRYLDVDAGLRFVVECGLFECLTFNTGNDGQCQLLRGGFPASKGEQNKKQQCCQSHICNTD